MKYPQLSRRAKIATCALVLALGGCSSYSINWPTTQPALSAAAAKDPIPRVQDCININSGSPSKYVCNGKTYTSHELRKIREDAANSTNSHS
jgi:hypothetical protein